MAGHSLAAGLQKFQLKGAKVMKLRELLDHLTPGLKKPFQQQLELSAALAPDEVEVPFILKVLTALGTWFGALLISMVVFGMHLQDFELVTVFIAIILIFIIQVSPIQC